MTGVHGVQACSETQLLYLLLQMENALCVFLSGLPRAGFFFPPIKMPGKLYFDNFLHVSAANSTLNNKN